jgi:hypothetical protein
MLCAFHDEIMKFLAPSLLAALIIITGCSSPTVDKPNFEFTAFIGEQGIWEISEPTFAPKRIGRIEYYQGNDLPSRLHVILGRIHGATTKGIDNAQAQIAALAAVNGGDAFIEGKVYHHPTMPVVGIEGNVVKYLPDNDAAWPARREFVEAVQIVLWAIKNENGATLDGRTYSPKEVGDIRDNARQKASRLATEYAATLRN